MPADRNTEIYGLVLVGGKSKRMGSEKALLSYDGETTQLERTCSLLGAVCPKVFVSQREDQTFETPANTDVVHDSIRDVKGPLCGILSAMKAYPTAHWLVLACDLPNLKVSTLETLIDSFQQVEPSLTAYRSAHDGLPEPLCAIYPSGSDQSLYSLAKKIGRFSPRDLLIRKEATLIDQKLSTSLDNINTVEEYQALINK